MQLLSFLLIQMVLLGPFPWPKHLAPMFAFLIKSSETHAPWVIIKVCRLNEPQKPPLMFHWIRGFSQWILVKEAGGGLQTEGGAHVLLMTSSMASSTHIASKARRIEHRYGTVIYLKQS